MTNQERILSNNNLIDEAIAKANSLPEAGSGGESSGGGGSTVDTCTVTLNCFNEINYISYTALENSVVTAKVIRDNVTSITLNNVLCGSAISFHNAYDFNGVSGTEGVSLLGHIAAHMWVISAPTVANSNVTVIIFDDD